MASVLGLSAFNRDSAAVLVVDGRVVAAAQEERFTRRRHDAAFPRRAVEYCLQEAGLEPDRLDLVAFYEKPLRRFERLLETHLALAPRGFGAFVQAIPPWLRERLRVRREIRKGLGDDFRKGCVFTDQHQAHAASAFYPSPFDEAAILTLNGAGEWTTGSYGSGVGNRIELTHQLRFPHSLGLLYSAFTRLAGFEAESDEEQLVALSPLGEPRYADLILEKLIDLADDGSFWMDMSYFDYGHGRALPSKRLDALFGGPPRDPRAPVTQREMDLAASVQAVTGEILLRCARHVHAQTGSKNLCLAGDVASNWLATGRIEREGPFEKVWVQSAGDGAGGALGVALFAWHRLLSKPRTVSAGDGRYSPLLGPGFSDRDVRVALDAAGAHYDLISDDAELCDRVAGLLDAGEVIAWFQGRMAFGSQARGSRSILADPRQPGLQDRVNTRAVFRDGFWPLGSCESGEPGLETAGPASVERVHPERGSLLHRLGEAFQRRTGCASLAHTGFHLGWDPIACTPRDAYETFMSSEIDALCIGHCLLRKADQPVFVPEVAGRDADACFDPLFTSPCCGADLERREGGPRCTRCEHVFPEQDGIAQLFWPHEKIEDPADVTSSVKAFYEDAPFPSYDDHDSTRSLIEKSRRGAYGSKLNESIPFNSTVLEVGCGTGQLSNFLGIGCRRVVGVDLCMNSLGLGERFRREQGLSRVRFAQMNLFRPCLRPERFDVVLCNGVLLTTADPYAGFRSLVPLVRPGGYLVIGLYNQLGRLMTDLRRQIFRLTGGRGTWIDPYLRKHELSEEKRRAWFADQYLHPHETKHTIGEVLKWFESCDLEFVRGIPSTALGADDLGDGSLFEPAPRGNALEHLLIQLRQVVTGSLEGGFFVMIARKPPKAPPLPA